MAWATRGVGSRQVDSRAGAPPLRWRGVEAMARDVSSPVFVKLLADIEWQGCGCSQKEESACPACGGKQPLSGDDVRLPEFYGHKATCWLAKAIRCAN